MYNPCNGLIISTIFNSATNGENDNAGKLIMDVYQQVLNDFPEYQCPPA
jgi:D-alanyl-D-alanine carboxypeptidase